jgi:hypothetical protein
MSDKHTLNKHYVHLLMLDDCHDPEVLKEFTHFSLKILVLNNINLKIQVTDENAKNCPGLPIDCRGVRIKCPNTNICIQACCL